MAPRYALALAIAVGLALYYALVAAGWALQ